MMGRIQVREFIVTADPGVNALKALDDLMELPWADTGTYRDVWLDEDGTTWDSETGGRKLED